MDHAQKALSRIIWQYRNSPKFLEWIQILPSIANQEIELPLQKLIDLLDIDNQEGALLDIVGRIVNMPRNDPLLEDDAVYRVLIKSKIYKNNSDTRMDSISDALEVITGVGTVTVQDLQDMTFMIHFGDPMTDLVRQLLVTFDLVPRPQGVRLSGFIEPGEGTKFGFSEPGLTTPADIEGFAELGGLWGVEVGEDTGLGLSDGSFVGMFDKNDPARDGGGKFVELIKVE